MKNRLFIYALLATFILMSAGIAATYAADELGTFKVISATEGMSKNGKPYVRLIVEENRILNGVEYAAETPAMCFGSLADKCKAIQPGASQKLIVSSREYNGANSYTVRAILK